MSSNKATLSINVTHKIATNKAVTSHVRVTLTGTNKLVASADLGGRFNGIQAEREFKRLPHRFKFTNDEMKAAGTLLPFEDVVGNIRAGLKLAA